MAEKPPKKEKVKKEKKPKEPSFSEAKNQEAPLEKVKGEETPETKAPPVIVKPPKKENIDDFPETKAIAVVKEFSKPLVTAKDAQVAFVQYQELMTSLMKESDIVEIQGKKKIKKTGLNKIARFFGVSVEIVRSKREDTVGPQGGRSFTWYVWVKAWLPNGQSRVDGAACSSTERRFAHLENDVMTTAITRASKRAIENLVGMGELELIEDEDSEEKGVGSPPPPLHQEAQQVQQEMPSFDPDEEITPKEKTVLKIAMVRAELIPPGASDIDINNVTFVIGGIEKSLLKFTRGDAKYVMDSMKEHGKAGLLNLLKEEK